MFEALGQKLEGDHLDLSFRDTKSWPRVGPGEGLPPSLWLSLGDPVCGPAVQLGIGGVCPQDMWLDTHYHGSDQFRALVQGEFLLQTRHLTAGQFGYQEAGRPYREGMAGGSAKDLWMFAVHGDRRGARSTMTRRDGSFELGEIGEDQLDRPVPSPDDPYWKDLPGGSKGVAALTTTLGPNRAGYAWGSFDDTQSWEPLAEGVAAMAGVLGHAQIGPVILTVQSAPDRVAMPAATYETEIVCTVVRGACEIGGRCYKAGDVRIQKAGTLLGEIVSGPDGADLVFLIADRRARPQVAGSDLLSQRWNDAVDRLVASLQPA